MKPGNVTFEQSAAIRLAANWTSTIEDAALAAEIIVTHGYANKQIPIWFGKPLIWRRLVAGFYPRLSRDFPVATASRSEEFTTWKSSAKGRVDNRIGQGLHASRRFSVGSVRKIRT